MKKPEITSVLSSLLVAASTILFLPVTACQRPPRVKMNLVEGVDQRYLDAGRFKDDAAMQELISRLPEMRRQGLQIVADRTGLKPPPEEEMVIAFKDKLRFCQAKEVRVKNRTRYAVLLKPESALFGNRDIEKVVVHELTHTVMWKLAGNEVFRRLPRWFGEGAAVWTAGQMRLRVEMELINALLKTAGLEVLTVRIDSNRRRHSRDGYLREGLAFDWYEQRYGRASLQRVIAASVAGRNPTSVIAEESGLSWDAVQQQMRDYATSYIAEVRERNGYEALRGHETAYRMCLDGTQDNCDPVAAELETFVQEYPKSILMPAAHFRLSRVYLRQKRLNEAITYMESFMRLYPKARGYGLYKLAKTCIEAKRWDCADRALRSARRDWRRYNGRQHRKFIKLEKIVKRSKSPAD